MRICSMASGSEIIRASPGSHLHVEGLYRLADLRVADGDGLSTTPVGGSAAGLYLVLLSREFLQLGHGRVDPRGTVLDVLQQLHHVDPKVRVRHALNLVMGRLCGVLVEDRQDLLEVVAEDRDVED